MDTIDNILSRLLIAAALALTPLSATLAQTAVTLPIAANAVADIGNGPIKVRMIAGNALIFTSQGSGVGSTSGSSTALTLTGTPATAPIVGGLISGTGITSGTTIAAYNGTTGITLSAAMTVAGGTAVAWGAACPSTPPSNVIQASPQADYYIMYTQARVCAISPGGPVNTVLIDPIFYDQITPGVASVSNNDGTLTITPMTGAIVASIALGHANTWTNRSTYNYAPVYDLGSNTSTTALLFNETGLTIPAGKAFIDISMRQTTGANNTYTLGSGSVVQGIVISPEALVGSTGGELNAAVLHCQSDGPTTCKGIHADAIGITGSTGQLTSVNAEIQPVATSAVPSSAVAAIMVQDAGVADGVVVGIQLLSTNNAGNAIGSKMIFGVGSSLLPLPVTNAYYDAWMSSSSSAGVNAYQIRNNAGTVIGKWDAAANMTAASYTAGSSAGLSVTKTVRAAGGAADCTLIFTSGLLTGGSC